MKCPGPLSCGHTCEHLHCDLCGAPGPIENKAEKIAVFVHNFGRVPSVLELECAVCRECYEAVLAVDQRAAAN